MIYGYIRTSRAAVDGLAGMHPETQVQALAGAGVELAHIVCGAIGFNWASPPWLPPSPGLSPAAPTPPRSSR